MLLFKFNNKWWNSLNHIEKYALAPPMPVVLPNAINYAVTPLQSKTRPPANGSSGAAATTIRASARSRKSTNPTSPISAWNGPGRSARPKTKRRRLNTTEFYLSMRMAITWRRSTQWRAICSGSIRGSFPRMRASRSSATSRSSAAASSLALRTITSSRSTWNPATSSGIRPSPITRKDFSSPAARS